MSANPHFTRPGAVDLSGLADTASSAPASGASYVVELTGVNLSEIAQQSMRYPVIVLLVSGADQAARQTVASMAGLVNAMEGRILLALADVDRSPQVAQAFGVQAVPTAIALIAGQVAPLFQGTKDAAEIKPILEQIHQVAVANGMTGRAQPQGQSQGGEEGVPASDPRFAAADAALESGDYAGAVAEFDKILKANPRDVEASAGRAQASLLARTVSADPGVVSLADAHRDDIDAQLAAADYQVLAGQQEAGLARLIDLIRATGGEDRERVRVRLVELFETCPAGDPFVARARRALAMALF